MSEPETDLMDEVKARSDYLTSTYIMLLLGMM